MATIYEICKNDKEAFTRFAEMLYYKGGDDGDKLLDDGPWIRQRMADFEVKDSDMEKLYDSWCEENKDIDGSCVDNIKRVLNGLDDEDIEEIVNYANTVKKNRKEEEFKKLSGLFYQDVYKLCDRFPNARLSFEGDTKISMNLGVVALNFADLLQGKSHMTDNRWGMDND